MTRAAAVALVKVLGLAVMLYLAVFYFRLGYFLLAVYAVGIVLAVSITVRQWDTSRSRSATIAVVTSLYVTVQFLVFWAATTESNESFTMRWSESVSSDTVHGREVVLEFDDFPGNYVGVYSGDLTDYLGSTGRATVEVVFSITRDMGCFRGFHATRVGSLTSWRSSSAGYSQSSGDAQFPWSDPWWCP